ncbi:unnamed protein product [Tilletia controversa]|uniref:Extracellular membrane protein CFEM domain-containing protein n=3 Tax=Tilletia TaxID=13289 RepID=A0A8X7MY71_9BASI|nr:hypothetical protein CF336_g4341 [Tilletia laevis]KAE8196560.1 hypothetical protein CF328_g4104 [Tilletia controversa]KAE8260781.1 hypothetical protein A4X03_0g3704 [Tilletia caries]KAE8202861.1 hypothetical protein CF335_g3250 [Tilletia laevis]KAE8253306.1 hypothetical protein A4X06_0g1555 [Tilletia controversa]
MAFPRSPLTLLLICSLLLALIHSVHAGKGGKADEDAPVKKGATCSASKRDAIQSCLKNVYALEDKLPNGPCYSDDADCYCRVQQGLIDCWTDGGCADAQPKSQISWNSANCAGQHGVSNKAAGGTLVFDLSKVKSASALPEPTAKKAHKKHKHHKGTTDSDVETTATAQSAASSASAATSSAYAYAVPSYAVPPIYATPADDRTALSSATAVRLAPVGAAAAMAVAAAFFLLVGA